MIKIATKLTQFCILVPALVGKESRAEQSSVMTAESGDLITDVAVACTVGFLGFIIISSYIIFYRHLRDTSELQYLRELVKCLRIISGSFVVLLIPLFWGIAEYSRPVITPFTSYGNGSSWNFGWGRPVGHFIFAFTGMFSDSHPTARVSCFVGMVQAIFLDTLSSYDLGTQIECIESGQCGLPPGYTLLGLQLLRARDLFSLALATSLLLLITLLTLMIGLCRTRYTFRQLYTGDLNRVSVMRMELSKRSMRRAGVHHHGNDITNI